MQVYKLSSSKPGKAEIYIGSTKQPLFTRLRNHRNDSKRYPERPVYKYFNACGWDTMSITLIETVAGDKAELWMRETYWVEIMKASLNSLRVGVAGRTQKEAKLLWYHENKLRILAQKKAHRDTHSAALNAKGRERVLCRCGVTYSRSSSARHRRSTKHRPYANAIASLAALTTEIKQVASDALGLD